MLTMFYFEKKTNNLQSTNNMLYYGGAVIIVFIKSSEFQARWLPSSKIAIIAQKIGISVQTFLLICTVILAFFLMIFIKRLMRDICNLIGQIVDDKAKDFFCIVALGCWEYIQIVASCSSSVLEVNILSVGLENLIVNLVLNFCIILFLTIILQSYKRGAIVSCLLFSIWSLANYYVILFHGSPFFLSELSNIKTVFQVLLGYSFSIISVATS